MLTISPTATAAIEMLSLSDVPERSGLRILRDPRDDEQIRSTAVIDRPGPQDEVIIATRDDARAAVFVAPDAAELVEGQTLDATTDAERMTFSLRPRRS
jgi:Fe-S cluster assembly iron-binding protein IscA